MRRDLALLVLAVAACLLPFVGKAVHMDDPVYLWVARQVTSQPLDFYGFDINWFGYLKPAYFVNQNPPLASYSLAGWAALLGWGEVSLHLGQALPAFALVLGCYRLARRLCARPLLAAALACAGPAVMVSATTLMADVLLAALWVWATELWLRGLATGRGRLLLAGATLAALCPLTKYSGLALLPLLAAYTVAREAQVGRHLLYLLLPLGVAAGYEVFMVLHYDWDPLRYAGGYSLYVTAHDRFAPLEAGLVGLAFAGGGFLGTLALAPGLWSRRVLAGALGTSALALVVLLARGELGGHAVAPDRDGLAFLLQLALFALAGSQLLALALADAARTRSPEALLLLLWVAGVLFFASFVNWSVNVRSMLPMAPAVGILAVRALDARPSRPSAGWAGLAVALGLVVGLLVAHGDAQLAASARAAAARLHADHAAEAGQVWFQGSWGFQHYLQLRGAQRLTLDGVRLERGDVVLQPDEGVNLKDLPEDATRLRGRIELPSAAWVATMSLERGAGFYAATWGPLPFVFGPVPAASYRAVELTQSVELRW